MRKVAITGSMGSGKSYVLSLLEKKGYPTISADEINRYQLLKGHKGYTQVIKAFSEEILREDQEIDKIKLASIIFSDDKQRKLLESIMHPIILEEIERWAEQSQAEWVFAEIPILFEANLQNHFDASIVVFANEETVFERLLNGRNITKEEARKRLAKQMSVEVKKKLADYCLDNSKGKELDKQLDELIERLKER